MPFYFKFRHFVGHENSTDVILCLYKMKRTDWLLCLAKNCDWFKFKIQKNLKNLNRALSSSVLCPVIDHRREPQSECENNLGYYIKCYY